MFEHRHTAPAARRAGRPSHGGAAEFSGHWDFDYSADLAYWVNQLRGAPALLELPTDRPRPDVLSYSHGSVPVAVPPECLSALRVAAKRYVNGLCVPLLASWMILLSKCSGQPDIVVGVPMQRRASNASAARAANGAFVLPMRRRIDEHPDGAALMEAIDAQLSAGWRHDSVDCAQILDALQSAFSLAHNPIYQTLLRFDAPPAHGKNLVGLPIFDSAPAANACDLALLLGEEGERIQGVLSFAQDLFAAETATRLVERWLVVLQSILAHPRQPIADLSAATSQERELLLVTWNATEARFPVGVLPEFLTAQARRTPGADAVVDGVQRLSYEEIERAAAAVAAALAMLHVATGDVIGMALSPGLQVAVTSYGILAAGGVCLPLDPALSEERLAAILDDARPVLIITDATQSARLPARWSRWIAGAPLPHPVRRTAPEAPPFADPAAAAYLIYTAREHTDSRCAAASVKSESATSDSATESASGTMMADPAARGIVITHAGLLNLALARNRAHDAVGPGDRLLTAPGDDWATMTAQLLLPLLSGACVVVPSEPEVSAGQFWERIVACGISHLYATPGFLASVLEDASRQPSVRLRRVVLHGAKLSRALCARIRTMLPDASVVHAFGVPEATFESVTHAIDLEADPDTELLPLGRPLANQRAYVLDAQRQPVPIGVEGILYVGGNGIARGYHDRAAETAQEFSVDPFGPPGSRLVNTRVRASWRADGVLLCHARGSRRELPSSPLRTAARAERTTAHRRASSVDPLLRAGGHAGLGAAMLPLAPSMPSAFKARRREQLATLFNPQGTEPPLFCVNAPAADLDAYLQIARLVDVAVPVCGLVARTGHDEAPAAISQRLTLYEQEVRSRQPRGPYRICGIRQSCAEAFELAQRLEQAGEDVLLLLIDGYPPAHWKATVSWLPRMWYRLQPGAAPGSWRPHRLSGRVMLIESAPEYLDPVQVGGRERWRALVKGRFEVIPLPTARDLLTKPPAVALAVRHINELLGPQEAAP